ncbi:MAG: YkgJ family cysteine cluster protein [Promethearchaeota archaeon]
MKICLSCSKCCFYTEMELSNQDIKRIEDKNIYGLKRDDFCVKVEGFFKLRNVDNHCIFLNPDSNLCKIYSYRPTGCKFYPLIFDQEKNKCIIDDDCPYKNLFYKHKPIFKKNCHNLRKWISNELIIKKV